MVICHRTIKEENDLGISQHALGTEQRSYECCEGFSRTFLFSVGKKYYNQNRKYLFFLKKFCLQQSSSQPS